MKRLILTDRQHQVLRDSLIGLAAAYEDLATDDYSDEQEAAKKQRIVEHLIRIVDRATTTDDRGPV